MQSIEVSYARYEFYKEQGIIVTMDNFYRLFVGQKEFGKGYGINKKELLETYKYKSRINSREI